ncbi:MAG: HAMP domain-containing histidine kinase [Acidiferrobacterales bacterium]|nr:HAMP domain-containing histidine kinase [Acidiferrobacterales bacterium]
MSNTLSAKLTRWYVASFLIFLSLSFIATWLLVAHLFDRAVENELIDEYQEFRDTYLDTGIDGILGEIREENDREESEVEFFRLVTSQGHVIAATALSTHDSFEDRQHFDFNVDGYALAENSRFVSLEDEADEAEMAFSEIFGRLDDRHIIHIGGHPKNNIETLNTLRNAFVLILCFSIPLSLFIGRRSVQASVQDIASITETAKKIRQGYLSERVKTKSSDMEISTLAYSFNSMLDRISDLVTEIREMTDNIAHDLKSPLARIRFMSEVALSKNQTKQEQEENAIQTIDECDRLIKMIDTALDVAEVQAGIKSRSDQNIDISALATTAVELFDPVAEQNHINLVSNIQSGCFFSGDLESLQRTISNLIDNALKYSDPGDTVTVSLEFDSHDLNLSVIDTGAGIKQEEITSIFKRFYRCDRTRSASGCGLGLSYCQAVVRRAEGNIHVESTYGVGSKFTIRLPLTTKLNSLKTSPSNKIGAAGGYQSSSDALV